MRNFPCSITNGKHCGVLFRLVKFSLCTAVPQIDILISKRKRQRWEMKSWLWGHVDVALQPVLLCCPTDETHKNKLKAFKYSWNNDRNIHCQTVQQDSVHSILYITAQDVFVCCSIRISLHWMMLWAQTWFVKFGVEELEWLTQSSDVHPAE